MPFRLDSEYIFMSVFASVAEDVSPPCFGQFPSHIKSRYRPARRRLLTPGLTRSSSLIAICICCLLPFQIPDSNLILSGTAVASCLQSILVFVTGSRSVVNIESCICCLKAFQLHGRSLNLFARTVPSAVLNRPSSTAADSVVYTGNPIDF